VTGAWRSGPLAVRSFRWLCGGQFASTIGDYCYAVALPWLVLSAHGGVRGRRRLVRHIGPDVAADPAAASRRVGGG